MAEQIESDDIIPPSQVGPVETKGEFLRIVAAASISGAALLIGVGFLIASLVLQDGELQTWASGLISLVVGAAIGFSFGNNNSNS